MGIPTRTSAADKFLNFGLHLRLIEAAPSLSLQVYWKRKIVCILNMLNIVYVMRIYCKFRMCLFLIKNQNVLPSALCRLCASSERQMSYYYKVFIKVNEKKKMSKQQQQQNMKKTNLSPWPPARPISLLPPLKTKRKIYVSL